MTSSDYTASSWTTVESVMKSVDALLHRAVMLTTISYCVITTLQNAKAKLQLNVPALAMQLRARIQ